MRKRSKGEIKSNNALLNIISPIGLKFHKNSLDIGENTGKVYGSIKNPQSPDYGWLQKITNIPGTICSINIKQIDSSMFLDNLSNSIERNNSTASIAKEALVRSRAAKAAEDGQKMMENIDQKDEAVVKMGITIMPMAT